ncbi:Na-translocating system protein MpsC family protein [Patulibacter defluvii]|uniref:Na-translocating system protein MpsC family protein n=1 Tax=Patulibacter defluvii TaxID=3095358 RepID=UPI002A747D4F|nr:Na-translocating system protein MpsC family protein [Patulibacter sp. DM4]
MPSRSANEQWAKEIANGISQVYKDLYGRGPETINVYAVRGHGVLCVLRGTHSPAERTQVEVGEAHRVRETRALIQTARREETFRVVEAATNRRVEQYVPGYDPEADVASELFLLEPDPADSPG